MSRIYDALLRAEEEWHGVSASRRVAATDLLERAERQSRSQQKVDGRTVGSIAEPVMEGGNGKRPLAAVVQGDIRSRKADDIRTPPADTPTLRLNLPHHPRLVTLADQSSAAAEAFRLLAIRLRDLRRERSLTSLLISSTSPQEGKSLIAANLACTLARVSRQTVLLLEGDMRRPSHRELFRIDEMPGLCEHFRGERGLKDSIYRLDEAGIWILPAGRTERNLPELIQTVSLPAMAAQLRQWFDWIVIDTPPILPLADTSVWEKIADGILLVARRGVTEKRKLNKGLEVVDRKKLLGGIMNSSTSLKDEDYYYYHRPPHH